MCAKYGVDLEEMIPHQHNSNGLAKRNNRMLRESLWSYINGEQDDWDQLLPGIQFAMNTSNAKVHKKSPYYAATGRELVMPTESLFNKKPTAEFESMDVSGGESAPEPDVAMDSNKDFKPGESEDEAVPRNIDIARNLQKTQTYMVKQVGKTLREGNYQIGDWVSLDKEPRSGLSKMDVV